VNQVQKRQKKITKKLHDKIVGNRNWYKILMEEKEEPEK